MGDYRTPQKILNGISVQQLYRNSPVKFNLVNNHLKTQLANSSKNYGKVTNQTISTQTPDNFSDIVDTPVSNKGCLSSTTRSFNLFPVAKTPPSPKKNIVKVVNPFEAALADRLHLPLIGSPSLFQRPPTPQCSSTHFEWTIEEVSSIGPANVEAHETQFQDNLDPELEAKTQAAISSFFKEHNIVPSPIDCPLRKQRIILKSNEDMSGISPKIILPPKRIRDGVSQTVLSLPPILPPEVENILKPYFNFLENQQQSPTVPNEKSDSFIAYHEARDASLRRKLFAVPNMNPDDTFDEDYGENEIFESSAFGSPPPQSPEFVEATPYKLEKEPSTNSGIDKNSFGSLSPISKWSSESPNPKRFSFEDNYTQNAENSHISPIQTVITPNKTIQHSKINSTSLDQQKMNDNLDGSFKSSSTSSCLYRSTPDHLHQKSTPNNMSVDSSFNNKISYHVVNNCTKETECRTRSFIKSKLANEADNFNQNEYDEDDMQMSQLSEKSVNSSQSSTDTPRRKKLPNRKNLSRSFTSHFSDEENIEENFSPNCMPTSLIGLNNIVINKNIECISILPSKENVNQVLSEKCLFYRTDSGFNEMTNTQDDTNFMQIDKNINLNSNLVNRELENHVENANNSIQNEDVSMVSCSSPTRKLF